MNFQEWWNRFCEHFPQYKTQTYLASAAYEAGYNRAREDILKEFNKAIAK